MIACRYYKTLFLNKKALNIVEYKDIKSLTDYFLPYSWCPNCANGFDSEIVEISTDSDKIPNSSLRRPSLVLDKENALIGTSSSSVSDICSVSTDDIERNITSILTSKKKLVSPGGRNTKNVCSSHYLVIKPAFVLTALRNFTESYLKNHDGGRLGRFDRAIVRNSSNDQALPRDSMEKCWPAFLKVMTAENQKLWKTLEHGLDHYLEALKEREQLDLNCESLRRQNTELRFLLQKYPSPAV